MISALIPLKCAAEAADNRSMRRPFALPVLLALAALAAGCDQLGIEAAGAVAARREADGKAVGGACRHAARAIEDCYAMNRKADRAAVFAGWREMNDYMRENKLDAVPPQLPADAQVAAKAADAAEPQRSAPEAPAPAKAKPKRAHPPPS